MDMSTKDQSQKSPRGISLDLHNVTFSQGLEVGVSHLGWLVCPTTGKSGPAAVLASHSAQPERVKELMTNGICGQPSDGLSHSEILQSHLENRLRLQLAGIGSPEYVLTWKRWDMLSGPQICALRASVRRTSDSGYGGWPTAKAQNHKAASVHGQGGLELQQSVKLAGWPTITVTDSSKRGMVSPRPGCMDLSETAPYAGWATPTVQDSKNNGGPSQMRRDTSPLNAQVKVIGMGRLPSGLAKMASIEGSRLNPRFSLWLQGYPEEWAYCGELAMQSFQR